MLCNGSCGEKLHCVDLSPSMELQSSSIPGEGLFLYRSSDSKGWSRSRMMYLGHPDINNMLSKSAGTWYSMGILCTTSHAELWRSEFYKQKSGCSSRLGHSTGKLCFFKKARPLIFWGGELSNARLAFHDCLGTLMTVLVRNIFLGVTCLPQPRSIS